MRGFLGGRYDGLIGIVTLAFALVFALGLLAEWLGR